MKRRTWQTAGSTRILCSPSWPIRLSGQHAPRIPRPSRNGANLGRPGMRSITRSRNPSVANVRRPLWAQHNFAPGVPLFQEVIGLPDLVKREHLGDRNV
jgi:hypothetical protein